MPLIHSASDEAFEANLKAELEAGKPRDQALAIAYSIQRKAKGEPKEEEEAAKAEHEHNPTDGQKAAGNYAKTHWNLYGLGVTIENLAGSTRSGLGPDGKPWAVTMPYHYGYLKRTEGADGEHVDCAVGPLMGSAKDAHIINQRNPETGGFDEHKVFLGFPSREAAITAFQMGRSDDPNEVLGNVITVPVEELKRWLEEGHTKGEAVLKAEGQVHVKHHFRNVKGKIVYIPDYNKELHGEHPEATLKERTILKQTKHGYTLQVFDSEDNEKVKAAQEALHVAPDAGTQHTGALHHGVKKAVFQHHYSHLEDAKKVHDALAEPGEKWEEGAKKEPPKPGPDKGPEKKADRGPAEDDPFEDALMNASSFVDHVGECETIQDALDNLEANLEANKELDKTRVDSKGKLKQAIGDMMNAFAGFALTSSPP